MEENSKDINKKNTGVLEKISYCIIFIIAFLTPIFFIPISFIPTQFGTGLFFAFGVITVTLIMIVSAFISGTFDLPIPKKYMVSLFMLVPVAYILAGLATGFSRMNFLGYTFDITTIGFMLLSFLFLFLVSILFRNKKRIFYAYLAFVVSSLLFSIFLLVRIIFGVNVLSFGKFADLTSNMIGNWNNVGIFFGIGVILSLVTYEMLKVSNFMKVVLTLALFLSHFFLTLVNFNIVWIILATCSLLFVLYGVFNNIDKEMFTILSLKEKISLIPFYSVVVFFISVVFIIWGSTLGAYLSNQLKVTNVDVRPSLVTTVDIARNTLKNQPFFGSGPNSFISQWQSYKPDEITNTVFWNTDFTYGMGLIPTFAVTTGIVGILSWIIFLGFYIYFGIKFLFAKIEDIFFKYLIASSFFVSLYLWIMACVYVPSTVVFVMTFFFTGLFFASLYVSGVIPVLPYKFYQTPKVGFLSSFVLVLLFIGASALGYGLFKNSQSLWYYQQSSKAVNILNDIPSGEAFIKKAIATVPYDVYYRSLSEIEILKLNSIVTQDSTKISKEEIQKQYSTTLSDAINAGLSAKNADSSNYLNWVSLGRVYESAVPLNVAGSYESAQFAYNEALRRNPKNPSIYLYSARLAIAKKDLNQARIYTMNAIQAKQNYLDAYLLLSQIEVADKNLKGAIDSVTVASVINPNDSSVFFQLGLLKYNNKDYVGSIEALEKSLVLSPDYANAKYFLGLSYEMNKQHDKAIGMFNNLALTNPESVEVKTILTNLNAGKDIFIDNQAKPEKGLKLPVKENQK